MNTIQNKVSRKRNIKFVSKFSSRIRSVIGYTKRIFKYKGKMSSRVSGDGLDHIRGGSGVGGGVSGGRSNQSSSQRRQRSR